MKTLEFKIDINAKAENVWFMLWNDTYYRKWTSVFCEGSYAVSDWKEGSSIQFLAPGGGGMYSKIARLVPNEKMYFTHIGEVKDFKELPLDDESKSWSGAQENYELSEKNGVVTLTVKLDLVEKHFEYFQKTFPQGLEMVKKLAEEKMLEITTTINAPVEKVWNCWTEPKHIVKWNFASDDWHSPHSENDLRVGGKFTTRMEAKDGSFGFDFGGVYDDVKMHQLISYKMEDGRVVKTSFEKVENQTKVTTLFQAEMENAFDLQQGGWQAILNNFKKYVEGR